MEFRGTAWKSYHFRPFLINLLLFYFVKVLRLCVISGPDWYGSAGWLSSGAQKGCGLDSWSGHMLGVSGLISCGGHAGRSRSMFHSHTAPSLSFSLSHPLSFWKSILKIFKIKMLQEIIVTQSRSRYFPKGCPTWDRQCRVAPSLILKSFEPRLELPLERDRAKRNCVY